MVGKAEKDGVGEPSNDLGFCCAGIMLTHGASCKASAEHPAAYAVSSNCGLGGTPRDLRRETEVCRDS
jgi:hypothetical protein